MEKDDKGSTMIRMGVSGWMFLLVPAYPGCPGSKAVKRSLLLLLLSGTTRVSQYQNGKTNLDFTEARDSEWQWHQLGHMQVCTSLQTNNHASTPPLRFLQARCPSCRPTNSIKALKGFSLQVTWVINPAVGCHYFSLGLQLPSQPLRRLLPFSQDCYLTALRLQIEPRLFCAWLQFANHSVTKPP